MIETMRPLPVERVAGAPKFVDGVAIVRGVATPVIDAGDLLGVPKCAPRRFVALRAGSRTVALAVADVIGIRSLAPESLASVPALLRELPTDLVTAIGTLDRELLFVLETTRLIPDAVWDAIAATGAL